MREIRAALERVRLLSLTGAGGSGKTRLALQVVAETGGAFPDGVVWVDLASLTTPSLLPQRVASAAGVVEAGQDGYADALISTIGSRSLLLVLDSCEHVVESCARLVEELLVGCPNLRVLLTTREALGIAGEHAWHVPPLSLPDEEPTSVEELLLSEAAQLFVDRARAARSDFEVSEASVEAVASICRRLDGIPLAIELAAARIRALAPGEISERLDHAFRILNEGARTAIPRHRTLRAAIDWSYDLLPDEEKAFLPRLSVFRGGFSLSAAEVVCGGTDPFEVFERISHLVDRSLVLVREGRGAIRYQLLETVRQYAEERLGESDDRRMLEERHARFFLSLVEEAEPFLTTVRRREWVERLSKDLDNVRQALAWSARHDAPLHVRLAAALCWFWLSSRHWSEGRRWSEAALGRVDPAERTRERALLLFGCGALTCLQGRPDLARPWLEESAPIFGEVGDRRQEAYALTYLGMALAQERGVEGEEPIAAALEWFRGAKEPFGLRLALLLRASLRAAEGEIEEAERLAREGVQVARGFGQDRELAVALQVLAAVAFEKGDLGGARDLLRESLDALRRDPFDLFAARALELLAAIGIREGELETPVEWAGAADAARTRLDALPFGLDRDRLDPYLASARRELGSVAFDRLWTRGKETPLHRAVDLALEGASGGAGPPAARTGRPTPEPEGALGSVLVREPALRVLALGPLEVHRDGVLLGPDVWRLNKPRELLVYLLRHPHGRTRDQLGAAFWPDSSSAQVKNSFHVTLHHLRKALGGTDRVIVDGERYRINPELELEFDAARFERELGEVLSSARAAPPEPDGLRRVLELYRGEFLEEEGAGDWHLEHRDRLRALFVEGLLVLSNRELEGERYAECLDTLEKAVAADQLREDVHRNLILCLARMGRKAEALRRYSHLESFLREELDAAPEPATVELAERLRAGERP